MPRNGRTAIVKMLANPGITATTMDKVHAGQPIPTRLMSDENNPFQDSLRNNRISLIIKDIFAPNNRAINAINNNSMLIKNAEFCVKKFDMPT